MPKQPPKVATYTIGTYGFVPNITLCAPTNPKGKGKAITDEIIRFLCLLKFDFEIESDSEKFSIVFFSINESTAVVVENKSAILEKTH